VVMDCCLEGGLPGKVCSRALPYGMPAIVALLPASWPVIFAEKGENSLCQLTKDWGLWLNWRLIEKIRHNQALPSG